MTLPVRLLAASFLALVVLATTAGAQPNAPAQGAPGEAVFVISGRGWGHGVGMSQYGAFGQAKQGRTHAEILAYYYSGTKLGRASKKSVRVLLAEGKRAVTVASASPFRVVDAAGGVVKLPASALVLTPELRLSASLAPARGPLVIRPGKAPLSLDGRAYRGSLEVTVQGGFLRVVNGVGLEAYIQGVVAGEMPYSWPLEALKAQAVAARTYALKNLVKAKPFDLYADVRSQVYGGIASEQDATNAAVQATAGQVVTYAGQVASTLYFSSSGGKTANAADVFGAAVPYLVSRPDPWDKVSPHHRWGPVLLGARTVQSKLNVSARILDATSVPTSSGRVRALTLQTASGAASIPASLVRTGLDLRSTWITIGILRLDRPIGMVEFGSPLQLTGIARNVDSPQLTSSSNGQKWAALGPLARTTDGTVSQAVKPPKTTRYRIEAAHSAEPASTPILGQVLLVRVSPRIRLVQPAEPDVLSGTVRPRLPNAVVHVERQRGSTWVHVGETLADGSGAFRIAAEVVPGTYRARVSPTSGFVEGVSPLLTVVG
jgi:stage II sporulation protein D